MLVFCVLLLWEDCVACVFLLWFVGLLVVVLMRKDRFEKYSEGLLIVDPRRLNLQRFRDKGDLRDLEWSGALTITGMNVPCWVSPTGSQ